jgi:hypothetical protein
MISNPRTQESVGTLAESSPSPKKAPRRLGPTDTGKYQKQQNTVSGNAAGKRYFDPVTLADMRQRLPEYLAACGVELRRQGTRLIGTCPMHDDSHPSFAVFGPRLENCGCYPCGFTGDVFALAKWMGHAGNFPDAVRSVAARLGVYVSQKSTYPAAIRKAPHRATRQPDPHFTLSDSDLEKIHAARRAFSDAFHSGDEIIDRIAASLGFSRETLRLASSGSSGLGLANGWLCYAYPQGLKWRNPDSTGKHRFVWIAGKATVPWRIESALKPEVPDVYLTEGESDCLALIEAGFEVGGNAACVASPGASFSRDWAPLFRGKRVILCFDPDQAGRAATARVAAMLKGNAAEILTWKGSSCHA